MKPLTIHEAIDKLLVIKGEPEKILDSALRDISYSMKSEIEDQWPIDTGRSISGFECVRSDGIQGVVWEIKNDVEYVPAVWSDYRHGGPTPLINRLISQIRDDYSLDRISKRVLRLLVPR